MPGGPWNHEPLGSRKLLLHKNEIYKLAGKTQAKGLTVIPTKIYFRNGLAKVEIALAQGKKSWDRRQDERDKEARRFAERLSAYLPLFGLRWVLILLNEFTPERWQRRVLAGETGSWSDVKARQLAHAREFLAALAEKAEA